MQNLHYISSSSLVAVRSIVLHVTVPFIRIAEVQVLLSLFVFSGESPKERSYEGLSPDMIETRAPPPVYSGLNAQTSV